MEVCTDFSIWTLQKPLEGGRAEIQSVIQHIFIEHLLCTMYYSRYWGCGSEQNRLRSLSSLIIPNTHQGKLKLREAI